jgi:hypothetical protein
MKTKYMPFLVAALSIALFFPALPVSAQSGDSGNASAQPKGINIVVILDASTSMRREFVEVQDYLYNTLIGKGLKSGDYLCLFTFGVDVKRVFGDTIELPRDKTKLREVIYGTKPTELGTDIGLMLAKLDDFLKNEKLPNKKTTIIWATDGKNDPPAGSPYAGKDVYDPKAFDSYKIVKSASYKVLLLSIGSDTAARNLSESMGGEYVEAAKNASSSKLGELLTDFSNSIEMSAPDSIGKVADRSPKVKLSFASTYAQAKTVKIESILVSVDGGAKREIVRNADQFSIDPNAKATREFTLALPDDLKRGNHEIEVELKSENNQVTQSVQKIRLTYAPFPLTLVLIGVLVLVAAAVVVIVILAQAKKKKDKKPLPITKEPKSRY